MRRLETPRQIAEFKSKVNNFLTAGWSLEEIADHLSICKKTLFNYYGMKYTYKVITIGYKDDTYMNEEEMIQGYQAPTFEELSNDEKTIYMAL